MSPTLRRLPDWPERLAALLQAVATQPFAWGQHDCARFAAQAVTAQTAQALPLPGWQCRRTAVAAVRHYGGLPQGVDACLPRLPAPALAQRGDVVLVQAPARRFLAVCVGTRWVAPCRAGLRWGPMQAATHAWGVGHG